MKALYSKKGKKIVIVFLEGKKRKTKTLPKAEILLKYWDTLKALISQRENKIH